VRQVETMQRSLHAREVKIEERKKKFEDQQRKDKVGAHFRCLFLFFFVRPPSLF
jgi:hypothetical protein